MEYRLLGASGLQVSVLSFGTMTLGGEGRFAAMGTVQVEEARRQVEICIEAGVNLFDTADIYSFGKSEEVLGEALGQRRKDVVLATKCFVGLEAGTNKSGLSRRHILEACDASLRRLGTDYIDLYQAHNFDSLTPLDETLRAFEDLVRSGQDPLFRLLQLLGLAAHEGALHFGPAWAFPGTSRSRSIIRCWPEMPNTNSCPRAWISGRESWRGVRCSSACCPANSGAASRNPRSRG